MFNLKLKTYVYENLLCSVINCRIESILFTTINDLTWPTKFLNWNLNKVLFYLTFLSSKSIFLFCRQLNNEIKLWSFFTKKGFLHNIYKWIISKLWLHVTIFNATNNAFCLKNCTNFLLVTSYDVIQCVHGFST